MSFPYTPLLATNFNSKAKIVVNQGGTWSGKTYNILQCLLLIAISRRFTITVVGQSIPNLKKGAIRDITNIIRDNPWLNVFLYGGSFLSAYNISDRIIHFKNGSIIEFTSYLNEQEARSGKRDFLFINEANGITYEVFWQLFIRTNYRTFLDYNPSARFWVHDKILFRDDAQLIISDHRSNMFISESMHKEIESIDDPDYFKVYARGLTGQLKGLVFKNWGLCNTMPEGGIWKHGMDFGYTNSHTALVELKLFQGQLYLQEKLYERGLQNEDILQHLQDIEFPKREEIIADSEDPKTIAWIHGKGYSIRPAKKGKDSVSHSLGLLKSYRINITADSPNIKKEFERYSYKLKDGEATNEVIRLYDHAISGARYAGVELLGKSHTVGFG